eukprot:2089161-Pleurochrysis_carterae.AAC.3
MSRFGERGFLRLASPLSETRLLSSPPRGYLPCILWQVRSLQQLQSLVAEAFADVSGEEICASTMRVECELEAEGFVSNARARKAGTHACE